VAPFCSTSTCSVGPGSSPVPPGGLFLPTCLSTANVGRWLFTGNGPRPRKEPCPCPRQNTCSFDSRLATPRSFQSARCQAKTIWIEPSKRFFLSAERPPPPSPPPSWFYSSFPAPRLSPQSFDAEETTGLFFFFTPYPSPSLDQISQIPPGRLRCSVTRFNTPSTFLAALPLPTFVLPRQSTWGCGGYSFARRFPQNRSRWQLAAQTRLNVWDSTPFRNQGVLSVPSLPPGTPHPPLRPPHGSTPFFFGVIRGTDIGPRDRSHGTPLTKNRFFFPAYPADS